LFEERNLSCLQEFDSYWYLLTGSHLVDFFVMVEVFVDLTFAVEGRNCWGGGGL